MADDRVMYDCFLCKRPFQFGPHIYQGKPVKAWGGIMVCESCLEGNRDGIVPGTYPHLTEHLKARGTPIAFNTKGWIEWPKSK